MPVMYCAALLLPTSTATSTYLSRSMWKLVASLRPMMTGVVPTPWRMSHEPSATCGICAVRDAPVAPAQHGCERARQVPSC
jgi:hypothetical protein